VFCGKIPKDVLEDELIPLFENCGTIWDLRLMMDPMTKQGRSFCFVTFTDKSGVDTSVKQVLEDTQHFSHSYWNSVLYWHCTHSMQCMFCVMVQCPFICLSRHGPTAANLLALGMAGRIYPSIVARPVLMACGGRMRAVPHYQHMQEAEHRLVY